MNVLLQEVPFGGSAVLDIPVRGCTLSRRMKTLFQIRFCAMGIAPPKSDSFLLES